MSRLSGLAGKSVIVAGGSKGIGYAISMAFAEEGARVAVVGTNAETAEKTAAEITEKGYKAIAVSADLTSQEERESVFKKVKEAYGSIDVIVNNAGWGCKKAMLDTDMEAFDKSIALNLKATYYMSQLAAKYMIEQGTGGRIVNISSTAALQGEKNSTIYAATKAGIIAFSKAMALEVGGNGINVNCVAPGFTRTNNNSFVPSSVDENFIAITPTRTVSVAEDIADACVFLCSDQAKQISAQVIAVDGGYSGTRAMETSQNADMQRK